MGKRTHPLILGILLLAAASTWAADPKRTLAVAEGKPAAANEARVALVIGNSNYKSAPLRNPVNDAKAIADKLQGLGFKVTLKLDQDQKSMANAIRVFGNQLKTGGAGLFYYAGHGMQVKGRNFLIPVDADIQNEDEVPYRSVDANEVLSKMETAKNRLNLMILDACRNNPFSRKFRSVAQGLAQMDAPSGTLVAFATAPGSVASDGTGNNGIYTQHLLASLGQPGVPVEQLLKRVRVGVMKDTRNAQVPWESSSLVGDFYFMPGQPSAATDPIANPLVSAISVPQGGDVRARIKEAIKRVSPVLVAISTAVQTGTSLGLLPNNPADLGLEDLDSYSSKYVKNVGYDMFGDIKITLTVNPELGSAAGKRIMLSSNISSQLHNKRQIYWDISVQTTVPRRYLKIDEHVSVAGSLFSD